MIALVGVVVCRYYAIKSEGIMRHNRTVIWVWMSSAQSCKNLRFHAPSDLKILVKIYDFMHSSLHAFTTNHRYFSVPNHLV